MAFGNKYGKKLRGVNLGGWLVLEKWMTPGLFEGLNAIDETSFCIELGEAAEQRLKSHRESFIGLEDFVWLAGIGINAVRIPVGHWIFGPDYPYHPSYGDSAYPYVDGGLVLLDRAFDWAEETGLHVVLDLHAAPGCQNGFDNGGIQDVCDWHTRREYIDYTILVLERLAERYHHRHPLHAIEVLNEPRWDIGTDILAKFYTEAYRRIRKYCSAEQVAVVFHDGFRSHREFAGCLAKPDFDNAVLDIHRYQCFVPEDVNLDIYGHLQKACITWKNEADEIIANQAWTYVGEWSLGLNKRMIELWEMGRFNHSLSHMDDFQLQLAYRGYAAAQLLTFEKYLGWFFWSYKTETNPLWSFKNCVEKGWLPDNFA